MQTEAYILGDPNYNKMLIYKLLSCFITRVVCARIMVTWDKGI